MRVTPTTLAPVLLVEPKVNGDSRGYFLECWHQARYRESGLPAVFVQDNVARSRRGILRGLHLQEPYAQGKLVQVLEGEVFDVAVDVRVGSPTFGRWVGERLSSETHRQLYIPEGFAHGYCVLSESALLSYKCTELYHPETEIVIAWNDPRLSIEWPIDAPVLSTKDSTAPSLDCLPAERLPKYRP